MNVDAETPNRAISVPFVSSVSRMSVCTASNDAQAGTTHHDAWNIPAAQVASRQMYASTYCAREDISVPPNQQRALASIQGSASLCARGVARSGPACCAYPTTGNTGFELAAEMANAGAILDYECKSVHGLSRLFPTVRSWSEAGRQIVTELPQVRSGMSTFSHLCAWTNVSHIQIDRTSIARYT